MSILTALLLAQMQVSGPPVAVIGAVDGDSLQTLTDVTAAQEDRRGNVYVVQWSIPYVAVFDTLGQRVATLGRRGDGPGEFRSVTHVSIVDDTIYVSGRSKFAVFSPEFEHVRDIILNSEYPGVRTLRPGATGISATYATGHGFLAFLSRQDSLWIVFQPWQGTPTILDGYGRSDGRVSITVGDVTIGGMAAALREVPLAVPAAGTMYLFHSRPTPTIREFAPAGWGPTVALPFEPVDVPESIKDGWIEGILESFGGNPPPIPEPTLRRELAKAPLPEKSAFATLRVGGPDGDIWVERTLPGQPVRMVRITSGGEVVGGFDVPEGASVISIRADHVWLLEHDELDVPFLRRYRLAG